MYEESYSTQALKIVYIYVAKKYKAETLLLDLHKTNCLCTIPRE
jgi:hypothetical protein